jgi:hypothetical protein
MDRETTPTKTMLQLSHTNQDRIAAASAALQRFVEVTMCGDSISPQSVQENLTDLLTDLRHLSDKSGVDFVAALRLSLSHYEAESAPTDLAEWL